MTLRTEMELSVKGDIDVEEVIDVLENGGFDVTFHRKYKDRTAIAEVSSYSVERPADSDNTLYE